jgi:hypothetical protein
MVMWMKKIHVNPEYSIAVSLVVDVNMVGEQYKVNSNWSSLRSIALDAPPYHCFPHVTPLMVISLVTVSWCASFLNLQVALLWTL